MPGNVQICEWRLRRRDGALVPVEVSGKILADGRWQVFARDVTERKRIERELEAARKRLSAVIARWRR